jgi:hypothetical protein
VDLPSHERHAYEPLARGVRSIGNQEKGPWLTSRLTVRDRKGRPGMDVGAGALVAIGMFVWLAIPVVLIMPFKPQTPLGVALSFELRRRRPS